LYPLVSLLFQATFFCQQILALVSIQHSADIIIVVHGYFKNGASLPYVIPGTAGHTHGVASRDLGLGMVSRDLGLDRRERQYSISNIAIDDAVILQ
jgi:hypothetical protein